MKVRGDWSSLHVLGVILEACDELCYRFGFIADLIYSSKERKSAIDKERG